jgi:hypothetical protein
MKVTKNGETNPSFSIDVNGNVYIAGGLSVQEGTNIAGWTVGATSITKGTLGTDGFHMYSSGTTSSVSLGGSSAKTNWRLGIGANFGVDSSGNLYAKGG